MRGQLCREMLGETYDEKARIERLLAIGIPQRHVAVLTDLSRSTISRFNPVTYHKHLEYNAKWRRERRERMSNEQLAKLVAELKAAFLPVLNRVADALEKIARH